MQEGTSLFLRTYCLCPGTSPSPDELHQHTRGHDDRVVARIYKAHADHGLEEGRMCLHPADLLPTKLARLHCTMGLQVSE
eukprot:5485524-Amphidinium_carterae.1